jgi:ParB-like chromosome segregation protein Spo0J
MTAATETPKASKKKTSSRKAAPPRPGAAAAPAADKKNGADPFKGLRLVGELGRSRTTFKIKPSDAIMVGIDTSHNEHHLLDVSWRHETGLEALAYTMARFGQVTPIIVNKDGGRYLVVKGRRRTKAARIIEEWIKNKDPRAVNSKGERLTSFMLRAEVESGDELDLATKMVLDNQRLDDTPMEKARKCEALRKLSENAEEGDALTDRDLAEIFNVTPQAIAQWKKAINLSAVVIAAVDNGQLPFAAALQLADLPKDEQPEAFNKLYAEAREQAKAEGRDESTARVSTGSARKVGKRQESVRPGLKDIRKVADCEKCDDVVRLFARWVLGEVESKRIKGVFYAVTHVEEDKDDEE